MARHMEYAIGKGGIIIIALTVVFWIWVREDLPMLLAYRRLKKMIRREYEEQKDILDRLT